MQFKPKEPESVRILKDGRIRVLGLREAYAAAFAEVERIRKSAERHWYRKLAGFENSWLRARVELENESNDGYGHSIREDVVARFHVSCDESFDALTAADWQWLTERRRAFELWGIGVGQLPESEGANE